MRCQLIYDSLRIKPHGRTVIATVSADPGISWMQQGINGKHVGMPLHKPIRRRVGRSSDHDLDAPLMEDFYRIVQPCEIVPSFLRLQTRPGKIQLTGPTGRPSAALAPHPDPTSHAPNAPDNNPHPSSFSNLSAFPQHSDFVEKSPARRGRRQDSLFP